MKQGVLLGVVAAVLVVGLATFAVSSRAANKAFVFRGDVTKFDKANGNVHMFVRVSTLEEYAGGTYEINAKNAVFYKYDAKQKKVRSTFGSTINNDGYEIVVKGTVDDSEAFKANTVVRNDTTVKLRGTLRGVNTANNYLDVEIDKIVFQSTGKAYRAGTFMLGNRVRVHYDADSTKFLSRDGNVMNEDEFSDNDEKITITNAEVKFGSRIVADGKSTIQDGKWLF